MVCAMPNTNPPCVDEKSLSQIEAIYAQKAVCDYGLFLGATADNSDEIPDLAGRACALKMYLNETFNALKMDKVCMVTYASFEHH
jgi:dihydroorotase-like cyclic amidohydrolase